MSGKSQLLSVLAYLKKQSLRLGEISEPEKRRLLAALLLQCAGGHPAELFSLTGELLPAHLALQLGIPSQSEFQRARQWLPCAPNLVASLDPGVLSYLYQFFCAGDRERSKERVQQANKNSTDDDTIAFTQLYTPTWVADYLLDQCGTIEHSRLLDPSCGAGIFLWRAFDRGIERARKRQQPVPSTARQLLSSLHGCDIDPLGLWVCALGFAQRLRSLGLSDMPKLNLELVGSDRTSDADSFKQQHSQPTLGSLSRDWQPGHMLSTQYDVVVGNPPYLGRKLLDRRLKDQLRAKYPLSHQDLCTAFIERGIELLKPGGRLGYITQASLLYLPTYGKFRESLLHSSFIVQVVELGAKVFPLQSGEKVNSILLVVENASAEQRQSEFIDLTQTANKVAALELNEESVKFRVAQSDFQQHRQAAFNYRVPAILVSMRSRSARLQEFSEIRQGLATSDNGRFIKYWWEVPVAELGKRWIPYAKGGGSERWYSPIATVIDWQDDGAAVKQAVAENYPYLNGKTAWVIKNERFYFLEGLTFSLVNTRQLSVRYLPPGCIFDVGGSCLFPEEEDRLWVLAYMNSSLISAYAEILNPTINYQVGDLKELPVIPLAAHVRLRLADLAAQCIQNKRFLSQFGSTDATASQAEWFAEHREYEGALAACRLAVAGLDAAEREIDATVLRQAREQFSLTPDEFLQVTSLSDRALSRRRPVTLPFQSKQQFDALLALARQRTLISASES